MKENLVSGSSSLESELLARISLVQSHGVWIYVDAIACGKGLGQVPIATARYNGVDYPVVTTLHGDFGSEHAALQPVRVPALWLCEELGMDRQVMLDPHDLPNLRIQVRSLIPSTQTS